MEEQAVSWVKKLRGTKKVIKVGKISGKNNILKFEEEQISLIVNKTKISLEITPW